MRTTLQKSLIVLLSIQLLTPFQQARAGSTFAKNGNDWPGYWFTCEFANRNRAPEDHCKMFDDEGFQLAEGRLRYIRILGSDEKACKGNKEGQCFRSDLPSIKIKRSDRGRLTLGDQEFKVRYLGCTQTYFYKDKETFREVKPDKKRCFWASKRYFYIAPYMGTVNVVE